MWKVRNDFNLKDLQEFGFEKVYGHKGGNPTFKGSSYIKYVKGYALDFYNKEANRKDGLIYIDKQSKICEIVSEDFDKELNLIAMNIVRDLINKNIIKEEQNNG